MLVKQRSHSSPCKLHGNRPFLLVVLFPADWKPFNPCIDANSVMTSHKTSVCTSLSLGFIAQPLPFATGHLQAPFPPVIPSFRARKKKTVTRFLAASVVGPRRQSLVPSYLQTPTPPPEQHFWKRITVAHRGCLLGHPLLPCRYLLCLQKIPLFLGTQSPKCKSARPYYRCK